MTNPKNYTLGQKIAAWSVHLFTSSGIVAGFIAIVAIAERDFRLAFLMLLAAFIIDGVDGTFARLFKVNEVLPNMSGKTIDYVIDFTTYAVIPAYLMYAAPIYGETAYMFPEHLRMTAACVVLLVSAMYYGREGMVSGDYYFIGFPVLWNFVAFYLYYVCAFSPLWNFIIIIIFGILHFVPIKYLYPSRTKKFQWLTLGILTSGGIANVIIVWYLEIAAVSNPTIVFWMRIISVISILYYGVLSIYHTYIDKDTKGVA